MNKLAITASAALLSLSAMSAHAECVQFTGFCDGLDVTVSGGTITGSWYNYDCLGGSLPLTGNVTGGVAKVGCVDAACTGALGAQFGWVESLPVDGAMDMYVNFGTNWDIWIAGLAYTIAPGSCGVTAQGAGSGISTIGN